MVVVALDYWKDTQALLTRDELKVAGWQRFFSELQQSGQDPTPYQGAFHQLVDRIFNYDVSNALVGKDLFQQLLDERRVKPAIARYSDDNVAEYVEQLSNLVRSTRIIKSSGVGGDRLESMLVGNDHITSGVRFIDEMLNGGPRPGNIIGLLAIPSGGKTTLCIQMAVSVARQGMNSVYLNYETELEGEWAERLYAQIAHVPISAVEGKTPDEIDPAVREKYARYAKEYGHRIMAYNMCGSEGDGFGGFNELFAVCDACRRDLQRRGEKLHYVFIDWLGAMIDNYCSNHGLDSSKTYPYYGQFMSQFRSYSNKHGIVFVVAHQLNSTEANKAPGSLPSFANAAEAGSSFSRLTTTTFAFGRMTNFEDRNNMCWVLSGKSRNQAPGQKVIYLDGQMRVFKEADPSMYDLTRNKQITKPLQFGSVDAMAGDDEDLAEYVE